MRLGQFDPPDNNPFAKLKPEDFVQSAQHRELAIQTAMQSFVLLKNNGLLPIKQGYKFGTISVCVEIFWNDNQGKPIQHSWL